VIPAIVVAGVLLVLIVLMSLLGWDYQLKRIYHFQKRRFRGRKIQSILPELLGETETPKLKVPLSEVRDLVITLQLGTSMQATLTGSLERAAEQFRGRGDLGERLNRHVEAKLHSVGPQAVLEGLVHDFDCPQLEEVLERIRMAEDGGISYTQVLAVSVSTIEEDIRAVVDQEIQKAPTRLTLPMIAGVFFPALILGLLPLVAVGLGQMRLP